MTCKRPKALDHLAQLHGGKVDAMQFQLWESELAGPSETGLLT